MVGFLYYNFLGDSFYYESSSLRQYFCRAQVFWTFCDLSTNGGVKRKGIMYAHVILKIFLRLKLLRQAFYDQAEFTDGQVFRTQN